jgi:CRP/FNR family transcriptional regulator, cyclic AMP receptor protein
MLEVTRFLEKVDLFSGLSADMLEKVAELCQPQRYQAGSAVIERGDPPDNFYLVRSGTVRILTAPENEAERFVEAVVITLGRGQSFGEMGLIDSGPRSATVKAATGTDVYMINCKQFRNLCEADTTLGYRIMRNIAADLSFKLRYRNLI